MPYILLDTGDCQLQSVGRSARIEVYSVDHTDNYHTFCQTPSILMYIFLDTVHSQAVTPRYIQTLTVFLLLLFQNDVCIVEFFRDLERSPHACRHPRVPDIHSYLHDRSV
jgi:hypothetical protein